MTLSARFRVCNHTELYQLCRGLGIPVLPSYSREVLIGLLAGETEPADFDEADHPTDAWRLAIMRFVEEHWTNLESQLTCPAKTRDPRACFNCVDAQVVTCLVDNSENETLIQLHRPKRNT